VIPRKHFARHSAQRGAEEHHRTPSQCCCCCWWCDSIPSVDTRVITSHRLRSRSLIPQCSSRPVQHAADVHHRQSTVFTL